MADGLATRAARLLSEHGRPLFGLAYVLTGDSGRADALMRDAVERAFDEESRHTTQDTLAAYARRGVYSIYLDRTRRERRGRRGVKPRPVADSPAAPLLAALALLPPQERIIVTMRFYEGLSCGAIGRDLDVLPSTARRHLAEALDRLGASLGDLRLDREQVLYGGRDLTPRVGDPDRVPGDALSEAFALAHREAGSSYVALGSSRDARPVIAALHRRRANRARLVVALTLGVATSMGYAGWSVAEAVRAPSAVAVEPSVSAGRYGIGVLSSDDFADESGSLASAGSDPDGQRIVVCSATPTTYDPGVIVDAGGNVIRVDDNRPSETVSVDQGVCEQRVSERPAALDVSLDPHSGIVGRGRFLVTARIANGGDEPVAVLGDSLQLAYDRPDVPLRFLGTPIQGSWLNFDGDSLDGPLQVTAEHAADVTVVQPGEEFIVLFEGQFVSSDWFGDPDLALSDDVRERLIDENSVVGERSRDDAVAQAFLEGTYAPPAGLFLQVAPTAENPSRLVFLLAVVDGVGEIPDASA